MAVPGRKQVMDNLLKIEQTMTDDRCTFPAVPTGSLMDSWKGGDPVAKIVEEINVEQDVNFGKHCAFVYWERTPAAEKDDKKGLFDVLVQSALLAWFHQPTKDLAVCGALRGSEPCRMFISSGGADSGAEKYQIPRRKSLEGAKWVNFGAGVDHTEQKLLEALELAILLVYGPEKQLADIVRKIVLWGQEEPCKRANEQGCYKRLNDAAESGCLVCYAYFNKKDGVKYIRFNQASQYSDEDCDADLDLVYKLH